LRSGTVIVPPPPPPPPPPPGQYYIVGQKIYAPGGAEFIPMGMNYGHNQLYGAADPVEDKTMGANAVRIIMRERQGPVVDIPDGDPTGSGHFDPAYYTDLTDIVVNAAYAQGLAIDLAFDSNCDINCHPDAECFFDGSGTAQNVYNNAVLRARFKSRTVEAVDRYKDKIVFVENGVEPANADSTITATQIQDFQEEMMDAILAIAPNVLFIVGGRAYQNGRVGSCYRASWATKYPNKIILTCDFLSGAITNGGTAGFDTRFANLTGARTTFGVPVICQQLGDNISDDTANDDLLKHAFEAHRLAGVGALYWEKVTPSSTSFGCYYTSTGPRVKNNTRYTTCSDAFHAVTGP